MPIDPVTGEYRPTLRKGTRDALDENPNTFGEVIARLCGAWDEEVVDRPPSPYEVCKTMGLSYGALLKWVAESDERTQEFERALRIRAQLLVDESIAIADGDGDVARDKLRTQTRQWVASKWDRQRYGEKVEVNTTHRYVIEVPALAATTTDWVAQAKPVLPPAPVVDAEIIQAQPASAQANGG